MELSTHAPWNSEEVGIVDGRNWNIATRTKCP